ncbi:MAG: hypothetical protein ACI379_00185 [Nocardioides sp.]|uniref:hypothetical protein n=1 Tax=Nocardioides sp. TaxID=35761 RepID=UPI003F02041A
MQLRRSLVTATVAVALVLPLSACGAVDRIRGFDYATDRDYTPAAGTNDRSGNVDILGAAVVSAAEGAGTLVVTLATNENADASSLTGVSGTYTDADGNSSPVEAKQFAPIEVPVGGLVNLAEADKPVLLTGEFSEGNMLTLTLTFSDGQTTEMPVPVVSNFTSDWTGLDRSPGAEDVEAPEDHRIPAEHGSSH